MPIVAMINRKGGVGKTTLTIALADFLSTVHARNILVIEERTLEGDTTWRYAIGSPYLVLHQAFFDLASGYDDVLIDCSPFMTIGTLNALTLAAGYLIPTTPDHIATIGIPQIVQKMTEHSANLRTPTVRYGTVVNRFRRGSLLHQAKLDELRSDPYCVPVWNTVIPDAIRGQDAMNTDATEMTLKSRYGGGTPGLYQAFESLATEFLARIG